MRMFFVFLPFLCSAVLADDPYFDDLASQLPIALVPGGSDQYMFFIVPVQRTDDIDLEVKAMQVQDNSLLRDNSRSATNVDMQDSVIDRDTISDPNLSVSDVFSGTGDETEDSSFNFQVPVVVPMNIPFRYDPSGTQLPQCTVDSRTWMENVVTKISNTMQLDSTTWDQRDLTTDIRLMKDSLVTVTADDLTDSTLLSEYMNSIIACKALCDVRASSILQKVDELTTDYAGCVSEALDSYRLIRRSMELAEAVANSLPSDANVDIVKGQLLLLEPSVHSNRVQLAQAYDLVQALQDQEWNEA